MAEDITASQRAAREWLSANLQDLRRKQGMSQEALADRAGLHRTYVSQVERKVVNISLDNIVLLADALKVKVAELLTNARTEALPTPLKPDVQAIEGRKTKKKVSARKTAVSSLPAKKAVRRT